MIPSQYPCTVEVHPTTPARRGGLVPRRRPRMNPPQSPVRRAVCRRAVCSCVKSDCTFVLLCGRGSGRRGHLQLLVLSEHSPSEYARANHTLARWGLSVRCWASLTTGSRLLPAGWVVPMGKGMPWCGRSPRPAERVHATARSCGLGGSSGFCASRSSRSSGSSWSGSGASSVRRAVCRRAECAPV